MIEITCPWPPRELSPNARCHWGKRSKVASNYRSACCLAATLATTDARDRLSALRDRVEAGEKLHLFINFIRPDRRARDDDNVFAAFKSGRDGIAQALGIDDRHFRAHPYLSDEVVKGGAVRVRIVAGVEDAGS